MVEEQDTNQQLTLGTYLLPEVPNLTLQPLYGLPKLGNLHLHFLHVVPLELG